MKFLKFICYAIFLTTVMFQGCTNNTENASVKNLMQDVNNDNESKRIDNYTATYFQLNRITGNFMPHGAVYEFDSKKTQWCERPMAADALAYSAQNDIDSPEQLPDLNYYFENNVTNLLNSFIITIKTYPTHKLVFINSGGNILFKDSISIQTTKIKPKKSIRLFKKDFIPGSMILTDGSNYEINLNGKPSINFSNTFGDYLLDFQKLKFDKIATVSSDVAYFHKSPSLATKSKAFVVKDQSIMIENSKDDFIYCIFTNDKGIMTRGWILKSDLYISKLN